MWYPQLLVQGNGSQVSRTSAGSCKYLSSWSRLWHSILLSSSCLGINFVVQSQQSSLVATGYIWSIVSLSYSLLLWWLSVSGQGSKICQSGTVLVIPGLPTKCFVRAYQCGMCASWYCPGAPVHLHSLTALEKSQWILATWSLEQHCPLLSLSLAALYNDLRTARCWN